MQPRTIRIPNTRSHTILGSPDVARRQTSQRMDGPQESTSQTLKIIYDSGTCATEKNLRRRHSEELQGGSECRCRARACERAAFMFNRDPSPEPTIEGRDNARVSDREVVMPHRYISDTSRIDQRDDARVSEREVVMLHMDISDEPRIDGQDNTLVSDREVFMPHRATTEEPNIDGRNDARVSAREVAMPDRDMSDGAKEKSLCKLGSPILQRRASLITPPTFCDNEISPPRHDETKGTTFTRNTDEDRALMQEVNTTSTVAVQTDGDHTANPPHPELGRPATENNPNNLHPIGGLNNSVLRGNKAAAGRQEVCLACSTVGLVLVCLLLCSTISFGYCVGTTRGYMPTSLYILTTILEAINLPEYRPLPSLSNIASRFHQCANPDVLCPWPLCQISDWAKDLVNPKQIKHSGAYNAAFFED